MTLLTHPRRELAQIAQLRLPARPHSGRLSDLSDLSDTHPARPASFSRWREGVRAVWQYGRKTLARLHPIGATAAGTRGHSGSAAFALALRRFGGLRGLHRRPPGDGVVPGRELGRGGPPVRAIAPVVVATGDGGGDLRQVECSAEGRQILLQRGEAAEPAVAHLGDEVVRALVA